VGPHQADIFVEGKIISLGMLYLTIENFGRGNCLVAGSAIKTCQRHFATRAANVWDLVQHGQ